MYYNRVRNKTKAPTDRPKIRSAYYGEMSEGSKEHDWKSCVPQKGTVGSNPTLSATESRVKTRGFFRGEEAGFERSEKADNTVRCPPDQA